VAGAFLAALEKREHRSAAHHARKILALREGHDTADLLAALSHALAYGALEHSAVERILLARATPRRLDEYVAEQTANKLRHAVAQSSTEPRDLAEYDALPCRGVLTPPPGEPPKESPGEPPKQSPGEPPCPDKAKDQPEKSASGSSSTSNDSD
jgi:hypothetical protein